MARLPEQHVVTVGRYELIGPFPEYTDAIAALSRRTEAEGDPGVIAYQFYADTEAGTAGNLIVYADSSAFMRHMRMMANWEERIPFGRTVRFVEFRVMGPLGDEAKRFLSSAGVTYAHFPTWAGGFVR